MSEKVKVRIAVAVDDSGTWNACGWGVGEDALIALVAGPYMWHHKMNELQERYAQGFDRCRELTIERIKLYCETRRAMQAALSTPASHDVQQPAVMGDEVLNALRSYEQADADGTFVKVSRQALDEAIAALTPAATPGDDLYQDDWISQAEMDQRLEHLAEEYEWRGDDGDYTPNERERMLLIDFCHGILADEIFVAMMKAHHDPNAKGRPAQKEGNGNG